MAPVESSPVWQQQQLQQESLPLPAAVKEACQQRGDSSIVLQQQQEQQLESAGMFGDDPVLAALQRYRADAGSTFHPPSHLEDDDAAAQARSSSNRGSELRSGLAAPRCNSSASPLQGLSGVSSSGASCSPACVISHWRQHFSSVLSLDEGSKQAFCGLGSTGLGLPVLPSWLSWINPWLEPSAPDCCGASPQGSRHDGVVPVSGLDGVPGSGWTSSAEDLVDVPHIELPAASGVASPVARISKTSRTSSPFPSGVAPLHCPGGRGLQAISELPAQFSSETYDELEASERDQAEAQKCVPDTAAQGLELGQDVADMRAAGWGLGKVSRGRVGGSTAALVTELRLPKPLDGGKLRRLGSALRTGTAAPRRPDLSCSMGCVPATSLDGAGVWVAWTDPTGSGNRGPEQTFSSSMLLQALLVEPPRGLPWRLAVARQVCNAVDALHRSGRCHGSLAPRNLWTTETGDVFLAEAGLVDALLEVGVLQEHDLLGLLGFQFARYLAPEGWHVPRSGGRAADLFALGLVLLEVLGGSGPPNPECLTLQQLSAKMLPKRGRWSPQVNSDGLYGTLPQVTRQTIEACFRPAPEERPSAQELLFSLAAPQDGSPGAEAVSLLLSSKSDDRPGHFQTRIVAEASPNTRFKTLFPDEQKTVVMESELPKVHCLAVRGLDEVMHEFDNMDLTSRRAKSYPAPDRPCPGQFRGRGAVATEEKSAGRIGMLVRAPRHMSWPQVPTKVPRAAPPLVADNSCQAHETSECLNAHRTAHGLHGFLSERDRDGEVEERTSRSPSPPPPPEPARPPPAAAAGEGRSIREKLSAPRAPLAEAEALRGGGGRSESPELRPLPPPPPLLPPPAEVLAAPVVAKAAVAEVGAQSKAVPEGVAGLSKSRPPSPPPRAVTQLPREEVVRPAAEECRPLPRHRSPSPPEPARPRGDAPVARGTQVQCSCPGEARGSGISVSAASGRDPGGARLERACPRPCPGGGTSTLRDLTQTRVPLDILWPKPVLHTPSLFGTGQMPHSGRV
ncbi:unnamed protein product [Polarella glacialis]|uniref:Protein kinase domain-containing protein n=1 Tax=Polarella glacialis TaxID=89957 RepID=A0A813LF67_POLGL|nr:unnamed protein product [Polarella glacialis]